MAEQTICCAGARLNGTTLSARQRGGQVWAIDLTDIRQAEYTESRGLARVRYALRLRTPAGWREVAVTLPRKRMVESRDLLEHRGLSAAVAERLADLRPGFRMGYRVTYVTNRVALGIVLGLLGLVAAVGLAGLYLGTGVAALLLLGALCVALGLRRVARRRWPDVTAAALPGILTAVGRREGA